MFLGEYPYTLDAKGRVFIPVSFREELGDEFILCKGSENTLRLYPKKAWYEFYEKLSSLPDAEVRRVSVFYGASAKPVTLDMQGRLLLPQDYREHGRIDKEVYILGNFSRAEIWSSDAWEEFKKDSDLREQMIRLGI